jgi:HSP20 family protein
MTVSRFEPWSLFDALQRDLDRVAGRRLTAPDAPENGHSVADWIPPVDIIEKNDAFLLRADVPGVKPEDIDISMENGVLTVSGQRYQEASDDTGGAKRLERSHGRFYRRFTLPETASADEITARCTDGILEVVIPKQPEVKARRITVESA